MRLHYLALPLLCLLMLSACTETPHPRGKPVAHQTYSHIGTIGVAAKSVDIQQVYDPLQLRSDISGEMALPPHVAIMDYARNRYVAKGGEDIFRLVLEQASVTQREIPQANKWVSWTGLADEDEYRFFIVVSAYRVSPGAFSGPGVTIKMDRTLVIPQRKSIAEREEIQRDFVDKIIRDLDDRIELALREQLGL
ncbi:MAG: hypothetical protein AAF569_03855 [Pseudomonadota bacterium]